MPDNQLRPRHILSLAVVAALFFSCSSPERQSAKTQNATEVTEMSGNAHVHHGIDYIEFTVTDMAESQNFYNTAFDWEFTDYGPDYAGIRKEGGEAGGFRLDSAASTGGPLVILFSKDLDATLERVRNAGGRITSEPYEFPGGRRFEFLDPSGNALAVWSEK